MHLKTTYNTCVGLFGGSFLGAMATAGLGQGGVAAARQTRVLQRHRLRQLALLCTCRQHRQCDLCKVPAADGQNVAGQCDIGRTVLAANGQAAGTAVVPRAPQQIRNESDLTLRVLAKPHVVWSCFVVREVFFFVQGELVRQTLGGRFFRNKFRERSELNPWRLRSKKVWVISVSKIHY